MRRNILRSICLFQTIQDIVRCLRHGEKTLAKTEDAVEAAGWGFLSRVISRTWCILLIKQKLCLTGKIKCSKIMQCLTFKSKIMALFLFWVGSWLHIFLCFVLQVWNSCKRRGEKNTYIIFFFLLNICRYKNYLDHTSTCSLFLNLFYMIIFSRAVKSAQFLCPRVILIPFLITRKSKAFFPSAMKSHSTAFCLLSPSCFMSFSVISLSGQ